MSTTHRRQTIREAIVAALVSADTAAETRVHSTRVVPWRASSLPAVAVYAMSESSDDQQSAPRELKRTLQLAIEAAVKQGDNVDDALDAMALEIERAMHADPSFGDVCSDSTLTESELEVFDSGEQHIGLLRLTYRIVYYTDAPEASDVTLDNLETVNVQTSLGGVQAEADRAEDTLEDLEE